MNQPRIFFIALFWSVSRYEERESRPIGPGILDGNVDIGALPPESSHLFLIPEAPIILKGNQKATSGREKENA